MMLDMMDSSINGEDIEYLINILKALAQTDEKYNKENGTLSLAGYSQKDGKLYLYAHASKEDKFGNFVEWKMTKPESIAHFLYSWLEGQEYKEEESWSGFDGSVHEGWRLKVGSQQMSWTWPVIMSFQPELIFYGK